MNNTNPLFESLRKLERKIDSLTGRDQRAIDYMREILHRKQDKAFQRVDDINSERNKRGLDRSETFDRILERRRNARKIGGIIGGIGGLFHPKHRIIKGGIGAAAGATLADQIADKIFNRDDNRRLELLKSRISKLDKKRSHILASSRERLSPLQMKLFYK